MAASKEEIARAFSSHRFAEVYPHLAEDVVWEAVGGATIRGRAAVVAACEEAIAELAGVTTELRRFKAVVGDEAVAIDALATYVDADKQTSAVAACDIYEFAGAELAAITSYNIEVDAG
jgi:limonene-1,2-epoxide hydrolase